MTYTEQLKNIGILLLEEFKTAKAHHNMQCMTCLHVWTSTPISKLQSYRKHKTNGCPICNTRRADAERDEKRASYIQLINKCGYEILSPFNGNQDQTQSITVKRLKCGHEFETRSGGLAKNIGQCPTCNTVKKRERFQAKNKACHDRFIETASEWKIYKSEVSSLTRYAYLKHSSTINPLNLPRGKAGQDGKYHLDHIVPIRYCYDNNIPKDLCAHPSNLQMLHWHDNVSSRHHLKSTVPPVFYKHITSHNANISTFLTTIQQEFPNAIPFPQIDQTSITIQIDQVAIQFFAFASSVQSVTNNSRYNIQLLTNTTTQTKMKCIQVYEDEWFFSPQLVISKIRHITNTSSLPMIHARKCIITTIDTKTKAAFLNTNHIQGSDNSQIHLGAFHNDKLVAVMTFCQPRIALGNNKQQLPHTYELSRFATDISVRIPGIASKLLSHFEKNYKWNTIYSFADRRWSDGAVYNKLNFTLESTNPPSYWYIIGGKRMHRWNYRKDQLKHRNNFSESLTEYENMLNFGIDRVWDCGTLKFVRYYSNER